MKTVVITGSTDGIGKLAAIRFAEEKFQVIIHGRNKLKLKALKEEIIKSTGNSDILDFTADLSDLNEAKKLGKEISENISQIDVLINNAGVFTNTESKTSHGLDLRFVVNYLSPVVLTNELIPFLNEQGARIINLSSAAQETVSLNALKGKEKINDQNSYAQSKLALTMWTFELARTHPKTTTIAVNPGSLLNTNMANDAYGQYWSPASKGSNILFELATSEEYKNSNGKYFDNDKGNPKGCFSQAHEDAYNQEKVNALLTETDVILKENISSGK